MLILYCKYYEREKEREIEKEEEKKKGGDTVMHSASMK